MFGVAAVILSISQSVFFIKCDVLAPCRYVLGRGGKNGVI